VEVQRSILAAGERAPQVPRETQEVPLEMRVKGWLANDASLGDEVEIITPAGRRLEGTLRQAQPAYLHGFGGPIPELQQVGRQLRALLREGKGGR